jgi:hypothetical protein
MPIKNPPTDRSGPAHQDSLVLRQMIETPTAKAIRAQQISVMDDEKAAFGDVFWFTQ